MMKCTNVHFWVHSVPLNFMFLLWGEVRRVENMQVVYFNQKLQHHTVKSLFFIVKVLHQFLLEKKYLSIISKM